MHLLQISYTARLTASKKHRKKMNTPQRHLEDDKNGLSVYTIGVQCTWSLVNSNFAQSSLVK